MPSNNGLTKKKKTTNFAAFDMFGSPVSFNINGDDKYKTVMGCFWTFLMLTVIILAFIWYFLVFVERKNAEVSSTVQTQDTYPKLDFYQSGFFVSIYATKDKRIIKPSELDDTFKIEGQLHIETKTEASGSPTEAAPKPVPFSPCATAGLDKASPGAPPPAAPAATAGPAQTTTTSTTTSSTLQGKKGKALSDFAVCSVASIDNPLYLEGGDEDLKYAYFRIKITQCDRNKPDCQFHYARQNMDDFIGAILGTGLCTRFGTAQAIAIHKITPFPGVGCNCGTKLGGPGTKFEFTGPDSAICNDVLNRIESRINDDTSKTYFTLSYTEGVVQPNNYDQPLGYFLKTAARVYGSVANTKFINMFWREVEVQTDKGLILENIEHKSTLSIDNIFVDTIDRGNGKARVERGQSVD